MNAGRTRPNVARTPTAVRRLAVAGVAATFVASAIAIGATATTSSSGLQQIVTTDLLNDDPLAKFSKLMPVVKHERCINCHGLTDPVTGDAHFAPLSDDELAQTPFNASGDQDTTVPNFNAACTKCHNDPAAADWQLAPKAKSFVGKTPLQICQLWKTTKGNSADELRKHFRTDPLAAVAFRGNKGEKGERQDPPPMGSGRFLVLAEEWLRTGNGDIPCSGWEGMITQTERVNLTTTHSTTIPGVRESTTETQAATRSIEIIIDGSVDFRIAVKGTQRIDSTVELGSGRDACTSLQYTHRVYETENGETLGPAEAATLVFMPRGAYALTFRGPREKTVRVERTGGTLCQLGAVPDDSDTLKFDNNPWTLSFDGVLPNPADRTVLKGSQTKKVINADAWLTHSGGAVAPLQVRDNGEMLNVEIEVTTTWELRRRD